MSQNTEHEPLHTDEPMEDHTPRSGSSSGDDVFEEDLPNDENKIICTAIYEELKQNHDDYEKEPIPDLLEILEAELNDLNKLKNKYDDKSHAAEIDGNANHEEKEEVKKLYKTLRNNLLSRISKLRPPSTPTTSENKKDEPEFRLPDINIPKFNGNRSEWIAFRNMYKTVIHKNSGISKLKKNSYLRQYLEGDALDLIRNIEISEATYDAAWKIVKNHYNDPFQQIATHLSAIINQAGMEKRIPLQAIIRNFRQNYSAFTNYCDEHNVDQASQILIGLFLSKVSDNLKTEWEKEVSSKNKFHSINECLTFMEVQSKALGRVNPTQQPPPSRRTGPSTNTGITLMELDETPMSKYCVFCNQKGDHFVYKCNKFLQLEPSARNSFIRKQRLCARCLRRKCNSACSKFTCRICKKQHNTLIHCDRPSRVINGNNNSQANDNDGSSTQNKVMRINTNNNNNLESYKCFPILVLQTFGALSLYSLLATAVIRIGNIEVKALLDSGSQFNFITEKLQHQLKLPESHTQNHHIQGIGGMLVQRVMSVVSTTIHSINSFYKSTIPCLVIDKIVDHIPNEYFSIESWNLPNNLKLADPTFNIPSNIDVLLGSNIFWQILGCKKFVLNKNLPPLRDTSLGWVISGQINSDSSQGICSLTYNENLEICNLIERFWEIENIQTEKRQWSEEERVCEQLFLQTTRRLPDGRFIVHLPFKEDPSTLGESRSLALKRFYYLERKLQSNDKLREMYTNCLEEYITLGHMKEVTITPEQNVYYIPHHAVFKESSTTTKLRTVFDASMKASNGKSLNDILMVGPVIQSLLIAILLRFRTYKYVFTADITKMYRQIRVIVEHTFFQLILWRKSPSDPLKTYALQTVTFGEASSPYLATRCLKKLAIDEKDKYPKASPVLEKDTYIDDTLSGANTIEEALTIQQQLIELTNSAGLPLCKWSANHPILLQNIPENQREQQKVLSLGGETGITTLGMHWLTKEDTIFPKILDANTAISTKRQLLAKVSTIYDPLGLIGPVITIAKLLVQIVWTRTIEDKKLNWDDTLPEDILCQWRTLASQLQSLKVLRIPRYLFSCNNQVLYELHGFADASAEAYGAAVYIRAIDEFGNVSTNLMMSKSRVSPLKRQSIPRLELNAALVLSELIDYVNSALYNIKFNTVRLWSDSEIALYWIHTPSYKLEVYEANRVQKIQNYTKNYQWDHVNSKDNPADIISRGLLPEELLNSTLWWNGPDWLSSNNQPWSTNVKFSPAANTTHLGIRKVKNIVGITITTNLIFSKFSNYMKLVKVTAYVLRFCINASVKTKKGAIGPKISGPLKTIEILNALTVLVRTAQRESFPEERKALEKSNPVSKNSPLRNLNPFIDNQQILRVGGRIEASNLSYNQKHPMILDRHHIFTKMIINYEHSKNLHANSHLLSCILRSQFWIPRLHDAVQSCIRKCVKCIRLTGKTQEQIMANLPKSRLIPNHPFHTTGIDYVGPVNIKCHGGRNKIIFKSYIAIFVCFVTKAIHLELVGNLSSQAFINTLKRFISRRGTPKEIYSDNGRNFVGAKPLIDKQFNNFLKLNQDKFLTFAQTQNIEWHFIPPYAPHWGGLWESNIKCIKRYIRTNTCDSHYNFEEYSTLLTQIEAILNSRPLSPITENPDNLEVLTPSHFLIGRPMIALPETNYTTVPENRIKHWQQLQKKVQSFWHQWSSSYLHTLQQRNKWQVNSKDLEIGDLVLIKEINQPPLTWPMGRIKKLHPGKDNRIRLVTLQTIKGEIQRSITKLIYLPIN